MSDKPISEAMLLMVDVLRDVANDTSKNGIAIAHLLSAITILVDNMPEGKIKEAANYHLSQAKGDQ